MTTEKPDPKTITPTTPNPQTQDDRFSSPSTPGQVGEHGNRRQDGRLANNVEGAASPAPRSNTAERNPDVDSFDATRSQEGTYKAGTI